MASPQRRMCADLLIKARAQNAQKSGQSETQPLFEINGVELIDLADRPDTASIQAILQTFADAALSPSINRIPLITSGPLDFMDEATLKAHMVPGLSNLNAFSELNQWTLKLANEMRTRLSRVKEIRLGTEAELRFPVSGDKKMAAPAYAVALVPLSGQAGVKAGDRQFLLEEGHALLIGGSDITGVFPSVEPVPYQLVAPQTPLLLALRFYAN